MKSDGRNSPFVVIEDEDVAELVVGKPSKMGNRHSEFYPFILIITTFVSHIKMMNQENSLGFPFARFLF